MAFTGYSTSGSGVYNIGSELGMNFVNSAPSGSTLTGGDGSSWIKNSDGSTTISKNGTDYVVGNALGSFQNGLDSITHQASVNNAAALSMARQQQDWSAAQAQIANQFNASEAAKNRDWQKMMSDTAHQREIADLKAAGLNPVLSAMNGNGASVTSGSAANAVMPSGDSARPDTTSTSGIVSLLGSLLSAQTQIANATLSARTQESVADKYTAMSKLVAEISAAAAMSNAATSAEASKYGSALSAAASRYASDMQWQIKSDFPDSLMQLVNSVMNDGSSGSHGSASSIRSLYDSLINSFSSLGSSARSSIGNASSFAGLVGSNYSDELNNLRSKLKVLVRSFSNSASGAGRK